MADDDDDRQGSVPQEPSLGAVFTSWEGSLEKLKILNYPRFINDKLTRATFVYPQRNAVTQFNSFINLCSWLIGEISRNPNLFKKNQDDTDPNTVANQLILALRNQSIDFRQSIPNQKLRIPHGEACTQVIEFLVDKLLQVRGFQFMKPEYPSHEEAQAEADEEIDDDAIEDEAVLAEAEDGNAFDDANARVDVVETSMDSSFHNILQGQVDPIAWKTELERVGPKLKTNFTVSAHEWRSHVDQTAASKSKIDTIVVDTRKDISSIAVIISEELDRIKKKETHINLSPKTSSLVGYYAENKKEMEVYEKEVSVKNEIVAKYTSELNEIGDKLEELKEAIDAKDNGRSDTSPVLKVKEAVKQIKDEIRVFDLRIGVVSNSLLAAKVAAANRKRFQAAQKSRRRRNREKGHKDEEFDDADDMDEI